MDPPMTCWPKTFRIRFLISGLCICFLLVRADSNAAEKRATENFWSLQPVQSPTPPTTTHSKWLRNSIDAFVLARLEARGLAPSPEADRRTLIRRLSYDLIGLPPTPKEISAFVADKSPKAYGALVDRLLASPHYGERWARHWLDVVHFGESHGFEYNQPRNNFWPYRNWVIRAMNSDMPYDRFVQMQIAGDVLEPDTGDGVIALGCLVTGPYNTTRPSNDTMRKTMRQDEVEDTIAMVSQTFLGLTANCARCHDHKFDPITQKDYYSIAAALAGVNPGERKIKVKLNADDVAALAKLRATTSQLNDTARSLTQAVRQTLLAAAKKAGHKGPAPPKPLAGWDFTKSLDDTGGKLTVSLQGTAKRTSEGLVLDGSKGFATTGALNLNLAEKTLEVWVKLATLNQRGGGAITLQASGGGVFDSIVYAEKAKQRWMAGSNGYARYKPLGGENEKAATKTAVHVALVFKADGTITGYREGKPYGKPYRTRLQKYSAGKAHIVFGLRHGAGPGGGRMLKGTLTGARLYNRALSSKEIAASAGVGTVSVSHKQMLAAMTKADRDKFNQLNTQIKQTRDATDRLMAKGSPATKVYTVNSRRPGAVHILDRGSVLKPTQKVAPAGIVALKALNADFGLKDNASGPDRRKKLANWITDPKNPLFGRVMANRIWHYHFGAGLVNTPNDFGFNGTRPSHPKLLDHLATKLAEFKWSQKALHRYIVTSATYRQSFRLNSKAMAVDASNRLLWRMSPRRLEAEELRDTMLAVSGKLSRKLGGVGYRDVREYKFKGSHFYDIIEQDKPEHFRRTIYRFTPRGAKRNLLDTFDCPDPSVLAPQRASTTTPLQSLGLMNNSFVLRMSGFFAEQLAQDAGKNPKAQIQRAHVLTCGQPPDARSLALAEAFVAKHGLAAYCRVLFNINSFLYVR
jgi:hypothetical protein